MKIQRNNNNKPWFSSQLVMLLAVAGLVFLTLLTYRAVFDNSFVDWDDYTYVVDNDLVRADKISLRDIFTEKVSLNYHPLTILTLRFNRNDCPSCPEGISPAPFIKWNVILHLLNTILVFVFIRRISSGSFFVPLFTAAVFAVHPMHVESVAWISERKDLLYSFFYLSGLISWVRYLEYKQEPGKVSLLYFLTLVFFILSCLSKAMAVSFPLALFLIQMWMHREPGGSSIGSLAKSAFSRKMLLLLPFFVISIFFGVLAVAINNPNSFSFIHRLHYAGYGFTMYIVRFLVPSGLSPFYPYPSAFVHYEGFSAFILGGGIAVFAVVMIIALAAYRKYPELTFGTGFFLASVIMVLQFISVGAAIMADRYTYLAYIGLAFIPAFAIERLGRNLRLASYTLSAVFVLILSVLSSRQADVWSNSETLWNRVLKFFPYDETARSIRGIYYMKMSGRSADVKEKDGYKAKALSDFRHSMKAGTARADVWESAGIIYGENAKHDSAIVCLDRALEIRPEKGSAYYNRALAKTMEGKTLEAISDYTLALRFQPENALKILNNRSNLYLSAGMFSEAIRDLDYLITRERDNYLYYASRGYARRMVNDISGAVTDFVRAIELNPGDEESRRQLNDIIRVKPE